MNCTILVGITTVSSTVPPLGEVHSGIQSLPLDMDSLKCMVLDIKSLSSLSPFGVVPFCPRVSRPWMYG